MSTSGQKGLGSLRSYSAAKLNFFSLRSRRPSQRSRACGHSPSLKTSCCCTARDPPLHPSLSGHRRSKSCNCCNCCNCFVLDMPLRSSHADGLYTTPFLSPELRGRFQSASVRFSLFQVKAASWTKPLDGPCQDSACQHNTDTVCRMPAWRLDEHCSQGAREVEGKANAILPLV